MTRLPTAAGLLALTLLLAACGDEDGARDRSAASGEFCRNALAAVDSFMATVEDTASGERYGGTAVIGSIGEISDGMNGLVSADYSASQHQSFVNLMTLVRFDEDLQPIPYLAESWEVNSDTTELTFHLRDDVYWHDGEITDAYDVAYTYRMATNPETGFPNSTFWAYYERGDEGVEVVDSFTVTFRMRRHAEYIDPWRTTTIMPEHLLGDVAPADLKQHPFGSVCPVGNGPFRFVSHRQDASWTFAANPAFPDGLGGRPYLDRYVYRIIPEQTTLLTELLTENIDVYLAPRPDQAQRIIDAPHLELLSFPWRGYVFVGWNSRQPQLSDTRVRRAITLGLDREEMVDALLQGYGTVANTGVPPFHWAYDPSIGEEITHDPDEARRLLEEAGWVDRDGDGVRENEDGLPLEISVKYNQGNQQRADIAEIMQAQLRDVGVRVQPRVVEWSTLLSQINDPERRDFDGVIIAWIVEFKLDDTDLFHSDKVEEAYGWSGTENEEMDRLLDSIPLVADRDQARELWREYQEVLIEEHPYTYLFFPERLDGVNRRLQDVIMDVRGEWFNIKDWWIDPSARTRRGGRASDR